jgi:hypothetical protein
MNNISKEDFKFEEKVEQVKVMKQLINDLGFDHIFDEKHLTRNELLERFKYLRSNNRIFTDVKKVNQTFGLSKFTCEDTPKAIQAYLNSCFFKRYGIMLKQYSLSKSKKTDNSIYKLVCIANITELVAYKMDRGLKLHDRDIIFKRPENLVYSHLIIRKDNVETNDEDDDEDVYVKNGVEVSESEYYKN